MLHKKELKLILTFYTTADAMACEDVCKKSGIAGRLIPVPRQLSAGCGMAWKSDIQDKKAVLQLLADEAVELEQAVELEV